MALQRSASFRWSSTRAVASNLRSPILTLTRALRSMFANPVHPKVLRHDVIPWSVTSQISISHGKPLTLANCRNIDVAGHGFF
jgi:hypothetical protein